MANRSAAAIFSIAFKACAEEITPTNSEVNNTVKVIARKLWEAQYGYDFTEDQMDCDDALFSLGFAKTIKGSASTDPEYPADDEYTGYLKPDGRYE